MKNVATKTAVPAESLLSRKAITNVLPSCPHLEKCANNMGATMSAALYFIAAARPERTAHIT